MKTYKRLLILTFILSFSSFLTAQDSISHSFDHGPYLQRTGQNENYIYFTTSNEGLSWIEVRKANGNEIQKHYSATGGLIATGKINKIKIPGLEVNSDYEYRMISKEIVKFAPYYIQYGDSITSGWYRFTTANPNTPKATFAVVNDIHDKADKYSQLLSNVPLDRADMVFMNGDMVNSFYKPDQLFTSFIDVSVEKFATKKPFVLARGNHETRGPLARQLHNFILRPNSNFYDLYMLGETAVLILDSGEDKYDHHREYHGATAFDNYREEQAVWLKEIVKNKQFRKAKRRIVIVHIPPFYNREKLPERPGSHSLNEINRLFMPILNNAKVDIMFCGHTHQHAYLETMKGQNNFPILINDNNSIVWVESTAQELKVKVISENGEETFNRILQ